MQAVQIVVQHSERLRSVGCMSKREEEGGRSLRLQSSSGPISMNEPANETSQLNLARNELFALTPVCAAAGSKRQREAAGSALVSQTT